MVSIEPHPAADAPKNWHKVTVKIGESKEQHFEVVCGGEGYAIGDRVAYVPVGSRIERKLVEPKDMKGVVSSGVMLAYRELGLETPPHLIPKPAQEEVWRLPPRLVGGLP